MIRCATYNTSGGLDIGALTEVVSGLAVDVLGLIEAPGRRGLRRLAQGADLEVVARAGRRRLGMALLVSERARLLSKSEHEFGSPAGVPDRTGLHGIVGVGGLRLSVLVTQLGLRPEVRAEHVRDIETVLAKVDAAPVLLADLNEAPGGESVQRLAEVLDDAFVIAGEGRGETYPTPDPSVRQDYVFVGRQLAVGRAWVPTEPPIDVASHHRPVVVEIAGADEAPRSAEEAAA